MVKKRDCARQWDEKRRCPKVDEARCTSLSFLTPALYHQTYEWMNTYILWSKYNDLSAHAVSVNNGNKSFLEIYWAFSIQFVMYISIKLPKINMTFWIKLTKVGLELEINFGLQNWFEFASDKPLQRPELHYIIAPLNGSLGREKKWTRKERTKWQRGKKMTCGLRLVQLLYI